MWILNSVLGKLFDILFLPFRNMSPWVGMVLISLLTSFLMLFIFRHTSNQAGIKKAKSLIKAHLLELRLFPDDMRIQFRAQGRILLANLKYIGHNSKPMLVMIVPVLLILIQLNLWFGARSLKPGESAILKIRLGGDRFPSEMAVDVEPPPQIEIETPPLRIEDEAEIDWRVKAKETGFGQVTLVVGGKTIVKDVAVGAKPLAKISTIRVGRNILDQVFNPGERPLPSGSLIRSVELKYPAARMNFFGLHIHWLVIYFVLSIIFGFAFKGVFKVEI
jgi:uncharacterized membrane protein (DUF106 family)